MSPNNLTILQAHDGLVARQFSCRELTDACLQTIEQRDGELGAFLSVFKEEARADAARVDEKLGSKDRIGILEGIPIAVKDVIVTVGKPSTAASKILEGYEGAYDATAVKKLKAAGAIVLGKTNCDEFAMGSSTENSAYKITKNPLDPERVPGGSSGGSAAAVAAGECLGALGTETGGSIRLPASFCGLVGLKPTYGAVSRSGLMAMVSSFDQIGPFGKTIEDVELLFNTIRGKDPLDATTVDHGLQATSYRKDLPKGDKLQALRIGVPKEYFGKGLDSEVEEAVRAAIKTYKELGCTIEEVSLPLSKYALPVYYILMPSEVSANLARYDGIRYGASTLRDKNSLSPSTSAGADLRPPSLGINSVEGLSSSTLESVYTKTRGHFLGAEVRRRIMLGVYALSSGYYEAYYKKAQAVRTLLRQEYARVFERVDALLAPTSPTLPFRFGEKMEDPLQMYLADIFTVSANIVGIPALAIPCPRKAKELPIGFQLMGRPFEEPLLFTLGKAYEKEVLS